ncbi:MAG TPA: GGDEF domain-containing protein [Terracidiphilus sp.]|jgi:diguanylate cyclase (GGDEF)-like protein
MNWTELPDLAAVGLLAGAFASVARHNQTHVSKIWLTGWLMIALHFAAFLFQTAPGIWGSLSSIVGLTSLIWAGLLFMWASVPYRQESSSRWLLVALLFTNSLYVALAVAGTVPGWTLNVSAALFGVLPLAVILIERKRLNSPFRWTVIGLYCSLSVFLLAFQHRPGNGGDLALNAVLFTVYFGCCTHFWFAYRRATAGAFVTITGFLAWAFVFVVAPGLEAFFPAIHVESGVWNLPKYLVAVGMILLLLEDQIEHNKHLALHDHLTGLPNRRLYQDRLASALERARRSEAQAALLVIDLDRFKQVNDTLGHHVGDLVLQRVGSLFASRVRRSDTVARTGGDEFSIILEEPTSQLDAASVGRSLMQLLDEPLELGEHTVRIGASVGIAMFPEDAVEMEALCVAADLRMYRAKHDASDNSGQELARAARALARLDSRVRAGLQVVD